MSLRQQAIGDVPTETVRIARAAFPKGTIVMRLRDEFSALYSDADFAAFYPTRGQPALAPWRLALVTVFQFLEHLSDRQAADAVRARIDWKYALGLELSDPDIFRGVEREMMEETGLLVRAGAVRFINEFFDIHTQTLMIDIWIECHPAEGDTYGEITMEHNRHDDNISDVRWWTREDFFAADHHANAPLFKTEFWDNLHQKADDVVYLGRWEE